MDTSTPRRRLTAALLAAAWLMPFVPAPDAAAQDNRPLRLVVGYAPGGPVDQAARLLAPALAGELKTSVIVENRPGANATTAGQDVARVRADDIGGWFGVYGPRATAPEEASKLNNAIQRALQQPELVRQFRDLGYEPWTGSARTLAERGASEKAMWSTVTDGINVD